MPKINLLKETKDSTKSSNQLVNWILSYGRVIIIATELIVFLVFFSRFVFDNQLADLKDSIEQKQSIIASASEFENNFRSLQNKLALIRTLEKGKFDKLLILNLLESITPKYVVFNSLSLYENKLTLSGIAQDNQSFAQLLAQFKNQPQFENISLNSLKQFTDEPTLDFNIEITLKELETVDETPNIP